MFQGTVPSSAKQPSRKPMWRGVKSAYLIIAMCLFPRATGEIGLCSRCQTEGCSMLDARQENHGHETSKLLLGLTGLFVVIGCLSSFQIHARTVFDNLEIRYTGKIKKPCPRWLRTVFRSSLDAWNSLTTLGSRHCI
ncbi:hypothetical protein NC651_014552 [Populus alba x Populus x berolinensis]|nr:hypothetical protein NC651_014552 [Populus alba x Populus x berolinensis]